jgi:hypothetical protein
MALLTLLFLSLFTGIASADVCRRADWALTEASKLRGLQIKGPVRCQVLEPQPYFEKLSTLIKKELPLERLLIEQQLFALLGLIPDSYQYSECIVKAYANQAAAFYSSDDKSFFMPSWIPADDSVLVHEATHALQDQHFNLSKIDRHPTIVADKVLAIGAMVEGDAMSVESAYISSQGGASQVGVDSVHRIDDLGPCAFPPALEDLFFFQYEFGGYFAAKIKALGAGIDPFHRPPASTREIIYPREYLAARKWSELKVPRMPAAFRSTGARLVYSERIGEFIIRLLLKQYMRGSDASQSAKGWSGDRLAVYRSKGSLSVVWEVLFESDQDALSFLQAVRRWLEKRFTLGPILSVVSFWAASPEGELVRVDVSGQKVSIYLQSKLAAG